MTPDEKRAKREARHKVQAALAGVPLMGLKLCSTNRQMKAAIKTLTDRFYSEQVNAAARRIEQQVIEGALERQAVAAQ